MILKGLPIIKIYFEIFKVLFINETFLLPHSSAQKFLLVQVFLVSILCLLYFVNNLKEYQ